MARNKYIKCPYLPIYKGRLDGDHITQLTQKPLPPAGMACVEIIQRCNAISELIQVK